MYKLKVSYYIEAMASNNEAVCHAAYEALLRLGVCAVPALIRAAQNKDVILRERMIRTVNAIGGSDTLPRKILAEPRFSAQERIDVLDKLRRNPFSYKFSDTPVLCRGVLRENNLAAHTGAQAVLNWLEGETLLRGSQRDHSAEGQELLRASLTESPESHPDTLLRAVVEPN